MSLILKNRIYGYTYINDSKADKQIYLYFQFSETDAYVYNFIFPKCKVSYIFFYKDMQNKLFVSYKTGISLTDAMDQPNFSIREPMQIIVTIDLTKKSINFITDDKADQVFNSPLFNSDCTPTDAEKTSELAVRQSVLDRNAETDFNLWLIDTDMAGPVDGQTTMAIIESGVSILVITVTTTTIDANGNRVTQQVITKVNSQTNKTISVVTTNLSGSS
jgi:hypothetical protein